MKKESKNINATTVTETTTKKTPWKAIACACGAAGCVCATCVICATIALTGNSYEEPAHTDITTTISASGNNVDPSGNNINASGNNVSANDPEPISETSTDESTETDTETSPEKETSPDKETTTEKDTDTETTSKKETSMEEETTDTDTETSTKKETTASPETTETSPETTPEKDPSPESPSAEATADETTTAVTPTTAAPTTAQTTTAPTKAPTTAAKKETTTAGTTAAVVKPVSISASVSGTHYGGETLTGADFNVTVTFSDGTTATNPAGFTASPLTLVTGSNSIVVAYKSVSTTIVVNGKEKSTVAPTTAAQPTTAAPTTAAQTTAAATSNKNFTIEVYLYDSTRRDTGYTIPKDGFGITVVYSPTDYIPMDRIDASKIQYTPYTVKSGTNTFEVTYEGVKGTCTFESSFYIPEGSFNYEASRFMFDLQNQWRAEKGKAAIVWSDYAYEKACVAVKAVGDANELSHDLTTAATLKAGFSSTVYQGENLACGGNTNIPEDVKLTLIDLIDFSESSVHYNTAMGDFSKYGAVAVYAKNNSLWISAVYGDEWSYQNDPTFH